MKRFIYLSAFILVIFSTQNLYSQVNVGQENLAGNDSIKASLQKAQVLLKQGNTDGASKIYESIMESEPQNKEAVQGWLMANMKRSPTGEEDAIKLLDELNKKYPENTAIIFFRAFVEGEYGHNKEALEDIDKLIKVQPDDALNYIMKGQVLQAMEQYNEASQAFEKATSLDPSRWDVWGMKAGSLAKTGKYDEAILSINKGIELAPDQSVNFYNRACIYSLKGDKTNALLDLQKAISMNPSLRQSAVKDEDFKSLYDNEDFKKLTQ